MTPEQALRISKDLSLPLAAVTEPLAVVARRGRGKTYAGLKLKEEMQKAGQKTAAIDPLDVWYGIRSSADGRGEGFPVVIFGGDHADVDLTPNMGREVADFLVNEPLSIIVVPDFETNQDTVEFMTAFLDRLLKANRDPLHLFFDEAEAFAPERPAKYEARMLGAMGRLVKRGRVRGLGATLITQRTASLNKNVLSQVGGLFIMALSSPWDRAPVERWVATNGTPAQMESLKDDLASLPLGEGYFWHPDWGVFQRIKIAQRQTFDSSATPEVGQKRVVPKTWADVDMPKVTERFQAQVERRKSEDPTELKKQLAEERRARLEAERELGKPRPQAEPQVEVKVETIEVPVLRVADIERLEAVIAKANETTDEITEILRSAIDKQEATFALILNGKPQPVALTRPPIRDIGRHDTDHREKAVDAIRADFTLSGPQLKILSALEWLASIGLRSPARPTVAFLAGTTSTSSGFEKNVSTLRTKGLIDYPQQGCLSITPTGSAFAVSPPVPLTVEELHQAVCSKLGPAKANVLKPLLSAYPSALSREELADRAQVSASSSGFEKNISTLKTFGLVTYPQRGYVVASSVLFLEGAA